MGREKIQTTESTFNKVKKTFKLLDNTFNEDMKTSNQ